MICGYEVLRNLRVPRSSAQRHIGVTRNCERAACKGDNAVPAARITLDNARDYIVQLATHEHAARFLRTAPEW